MADSAKAAELEARRAEIMAKVAAAKKERAAREAAQQEKAPDASMYGTHIGITCDGCGTVPMVRDTPCADGNGGLIHARDPLSPNLGSQVGYRWRCKNCKNHDLCDACYDVFKGVSASPCRCSRRRCGPRRSGSRSRRAG